MRHAGKLIGGAAIALLALAGCSGGSGSPSPVTPERTATPGTMPPRFYGVTLDNVTNLGHIVASLAHLPARPAVRIAFDPGIPPADYRSAVAAISKVAYVMAEPVDSSEVTGYTTAQYIARFRRYVNAFAPEVSIWEVGNEVNGDWLGPARRVTADIAGAFHVIATANMQTALTLSYEPGCAGDSAHDMWTWAAKNIPAAMKKSLDYVLVSYYEEDCNDYRPTPAQWTTVFRGLHAMFPHARLGFGEVGTNRTDTTVYKSAYLDRYYRLTIKLPQYCGGYFWWYYAEDMLPYRHNPLYRALSVAMRQ